MKNLLLAFLVLSHTISYSQKAEYFTSYGQVWGFLKYHHEYPISVDWDARLLEDYRKLQNANQESFYTLIDSLLNDCSSVKENEKDTSNLELMTGVFDWIEKSSLKEEQKETILKIWRNKASFDNKYISITKVGTGDFSSEQDYMDVEFNESYRYLALSRYWNAINYFFPYRDLIPRDWTEVYNEMIPVFKNCSNRIDYLHAVKQLSSEIHDGHGFVTPNEEVEEKFMSSGYRYAPFYSKYLIDGTFILETLNTEKIKTPLEVGDKIISINGVETETRWNQVGKYQPSSNEYTERRSDYLFKRFEIDSISIRVLRDEKEFDFMLPTVTRDDLYNYWMSIKSDQNDEKQPYSQMVDSISGKNYLYVDLAILEESDVDRQFKKTLKNNEHVILDVRNYPNWTILALSKVLIKGKKHFALGGRMHSQNPGYIRWTTTQKIGGRKEYSGNVYILVDNVTQSQAEYTVMAFQQHPRSVTIGGQTAGADGNITRIPLPYGLKATISGIAIVYPDGSQTQQSGVNRDVEVYQDKFYLTHKEDKILNEALRLIREGGK